MIRDMFHSVPARPAIIIAPIVILLCLGIYYYDKKISCNKQASMREELRQGVEKLDPTTIFKLADWTAFPWDKVQVYNNFKPRGKQPGCIFEWDWTDTQRQKIIDAGLMTVLLFANEGRLVESIELRSDQLDVQVEGGEVLTPEDALFSIKTSSGEGTNLILSLSN